MEEFIGLDTSKTEEYYGFVSNQERKSNYFLLILFIAIILIISYAIYLDLKKSKEDEMYSGDNN